MKRYPGLNQRAPFPQVPTRRGRSELEAEGLAPAREASGKSVCCDKISFLRCPAEGVFCRSCFHVTTRNKPVSYFVYETQIEREEHLDNLPLSGCINVFSMSLFIHTCIGNSLFTKLIHQFMACENHIELKADLVMMTKLCIEPKITFKFVFFITSILATRMKKEQQFL